jgi:hypothetical protein
MKLFNAPSHIFRTVATVLVFIAAFITPLMFHKATAACGALPTNLGTNTFTVNVPGNGTYRFWAHVFSPVSGSDAVYLQVDQSYCQVTVGNGNAVANQFTWVDYQGGTSSNKMNLSLSSGNHTFTLAGMESNVGVDKIILTADQACVPTGDGSNCTQATTTTGPIITTPGTSGSTNAPSVTGTISLPSAANGSAVTYYLNGKPIQGTQLDTTKLQDGTYTLKRVEVDANGQTKEVEQKIVVDNHKTLGERVMHIAKSPVAWVSLPLLLIGGAMLVVWRLRPPLLTAVRAWVLSKVLRKPFVTPAPPSQGTVIYTSANSHKLRLSRGAIAIGSSLIVIVIGAVVFYTLAATNSVSYLVWNGTLSNGATIVSKTEASGGKMVQFAAPAPSPPAPTPTPPPSSPVTTCSSVSQYGITFTFNKAYPCGTFANGDNWVAPNSGDSGVVVSSMNPVASGGRNGWLVNPTSPQESYDNRLDDYNAALMPALPYTATGDKSIIKTISYTGTCGNDGSTHYPCLTTASVLTVLGSVPAGNGNGIFRPPYFGTAKPLYTTAQLQTNLLPSLAPVTGAPTLAQVQTRYQRVQLDHTDNWYGRYMHPRDDFMSFDGGSRHNYGSDMASDNNDAALRLMLNDSVSAKMPALINYVQAGIDWNYTVKGGIRYPSNGGHFVGRKLPSVFAAILLGDQSLKDFIKTAPYGAFGDDGHVYYSSAAGRVLFGQNSCGAGEYDSARGGGSGAKDCKDPIQMIDGGAEPGGEYQFCCISMPYKGSSLAARLLPGGKATWNFDYFHDYVDRWVSFGAWTQPDPQNRFPAQHGAGKNDGYYDTPFQYNMWNAYRSTFP